MERKKALARIGCSRSNGDGREIRKEEQRRNSTQGTMSVRLVRVLPGIDDRCCSNERGLQLSQDQKYPDVDCVVMRMKQYEGILRLDEDNGVPLCEKRHVKVRCN